ncbi:ABC transporter permease [Microbacterium sp. ET2]|uniref:ABC transporter permease n=1 Tax=Microbacterium albipurpureum TaxID=3050384 RepID=UPI00259C6C65|nr:ABC transporter permease [Microbacterium sp. ET2 (Ac-2212)]WJL97010.1 ABC transporter permease [Microbacterium sp. ET2 (Ac-2212)]
MKYIIRRVLFYAVTAWAAITINFVLPRLIPGDPVQSLLTRFRGQISPEATASLYVLFGLDSSQSIWEQYVSYWAQLFRGDLGLSFTYFPTPVSTVIEQSLPWTVTLVGISTVIGFVLGTVAGILAGWRRGGWAERLIPITSFFSSVPYFWLALLIIAIFSVNLGWFPDAGGYDIFTDPGWNAAFISSAIYHGILPALTIVVSSFAGWMLGMRNMMVTVTSEDYVVVAHAKGLSERVVNFAYAARNAVLPSISGFALSLGFIVGGSLLTEMVFSYPGIGFVMFQAVQAKDYPLMQGLFLVITFAVLIANLIADMAYVLLDPRTRSEA